MSKLTPEELVEIEQHSKRYKDTTAQALLGHIAAQDADREFWDKQWHDRCERLEAELKESRATYKAFEEYTAECVSNQMKLKAHIAAQDAELAALRIELEALWQSGERQEQELLRLLDQEQEWLRLLQKPR